MNKPFDFNFVVVIRAAGERTMDICRQIVLNELNENDVHVIVCTPFEEALRESYRIGMKSDKKWMITIDADVLPRPGFISEIESLTKNVHEKVFTFKVMIFDKLFLTHRGGGVRVYRNEHLNTAFDYISANGETIRPESHTIRKMEQKGYKTKVFEYVVGLHDYEQYYRDIYRKAFFHATKHPSHIAESIALWKQQSMQDVDYKVALKGAIDGLLSEDQPKPDIRFFETISEKAIRELNLIEKSQPDTENVLEFIERTLTDAGDFHKEYSLGGIRANLKKRGILKGSLLTFAYLLETTGSKFRTIAD